MAISKTKTSHFTIRQFLTKNHIKTCGHNIEHISFSMDDNHMLISSSNIEKEKWSRQLPSTKCLLFTKTFQILDDF